MTQHVTQKNIDTEKAIISSVVDEVYAASAATASEVGGGTLFGEATRLPEDVERDMSKWYPQLNSNIMKLRSAALVSRPAPQVGPLDTRSDTFQ
jgi:hypothetical protein